jgi:hypothetical protein
MFNQYMVVLHFEPLTHIRITSPIRCDHGKNPIAIGYYVTGFEFIRKSRWPPPGSEELRYSPGPENFFFWKGESSGVGEGVSRHKEMINF